MLCKRSTTDRWYFCGLHDFILLEKRNAQNVWEVFSRQHMNLAGIRTKMLTCQLSKFDVYDLLVAYNLLTPILLYLYYFPKWGKITNNTYILGLELFYNIFIDRLETAASLPISLEYKIA